MTGLTNQEIRKIVNRYIGVFDGYLSNFTYRNHTDFYPEYCDLDIDPNDYVGTTRQRFITILENAVPDAQAKIVCGVLQRFPLDAEDKKPTTRTKGLYDELATISQRLKNIQAPIISEDEDFITKNEVFISYAWGDYSEEFVNQLDKTFQSKGITIVRDKRGLGFKGRIKSFMESIGCGKAVIVIVSDRYLKSENCMFELIQISKNGQFFDRIFPIVLQDAKIYKPAQRIKYIQYWEEQIKELDKEIKTVGAANLQGFREDIDLYTEIRSAIAELTNILRDMNTLTPDIHVESNFEVLFDVVKCKIYEKLDGENLEQTSMRSTSVKDSTMVSHDLLPQAWSSSERSLKIRVHRAIFVKNMIECYFVNLTNLSPSRVIEITHVWYEGEENCSISLIQSSRSLPVRLELDQSWETWIPVSNLPETSRDNAYYNFRARISTGAIFQSERNTDVPPRGMVPGGPI